MGNVEAQTPKEIATVIVNCPNCGVRQIHTIFEDNVFKKEGNIIIDNPICGSCRQLFSIRFDTNAKKVVKVY